MKLSDIGISEYLFQLGLIAQDKVGVHLCPYREEKNKSFLILRDNKGFKDLSIDDKAHNIYTLVERLGIATIPMGREPKEWQEFNTKALNAIGATSSEYTPIKTSPIKSVTKREFTVTEFTDKRLLNYMISRGVSTNIVERLSDIGQLAQVNIKSTKTNKFYSYIGFKNRKGGYSCRNAVMKSSIGQSGIAKVEGKEFTFYIANSTSNMGLVLEDIKSNNVSSSVIFEGFFDFLSFVSSKSCMNWLELDHLNLVLDNGQGGDIATIKAQLAGLKSRDLRAKFKDYEDVNDFIMGKRGKGKHPRFAYIRGDLIVKKEVSSYPIIYENIANAMDVVTHHITAKIES